MHELRWIAEGSGATSGADQRPRAQRRELAAWLIAGAAVLAFASLVARTALSVTRTEPDLLATRFEILTPSTSDPTFFALSPDGRQMAFVADAEGVPRIWVRPIDRFSAHTLAGTENASQPFWAPDGRALGFFAGAN
jgi:hypothetical protein